MKKLISWSVLVLFFLTSFVVQFPPKPVRLFDGKTFSGWEGDTLNMWRIENGALIGGMLDKKVPHNDFLCTTRSYANFILKLKVKLTGNVGFINSGIQFRSQRLKDPAHEMTGYQADYGEKYWGTLYDESRRNKTIAGNDPNETQKIIKLNDWNNYELRAENRRIRIFINGKQTTDYTEADLTIPQSGLIGLQIHGDGAAQVAFKDIFIQELP
ncbi:3-keto-disaccharide hydrolase [Emticicia sp. SJ17W-69]|uniref:3-keto-disaccharide hydrolase n=1 Tax=Emticicia sp. SJ17W-69 TaxID=3421657 RepID=UPI003EBA4485